jgi:hypothetical protein
MDARNGMDTPLFSSPAAPQPSVAICAYVPCDPTPISALASGRVTGLWLGEDWHIGAFGPLAAAISQWQAHNRRLSIVIALKPRDLCDPCLGDDLVEAMEGFTIDPSAIVLHCGEDDVFDGGPAALASLERLAGQGFRLVLKVQSKPLLSLDKRLRRLFCGLSCDVRDLYATHGEAENAYTRRLLAARAAHFDIIARGDIGPSLRAHCAALGVTHIQAGTDHIQ